MKIIQLTQGKFALVDDKDYEWLSKFRWYAWRGGRGSYYARRCEGKTKIYMHREILALKDSNIQCDHKDHNGLNNQRDNLRVATALQNCANGVSRKNSSSQYLGVGWDRDLKKWRAKIQKNYIYKNLGSFSCEEDAAKAYNIAAIEWHGEFANLNKIA